MGQAAHAIESETAGHHPSPSRLNVHLRIAVATASETETVEGELVSIAQDSMLVRAPIELLPQAQVSLCFQLLGDRTCEARGRVIARQDDAYEIVLEQRSPDMERCLDELDKLPVSLRPVYLADVIQPRLDVTG